MKSKLNRLLLYRSELRANALQRNNTNKLGSSNIQNRNGDKSHWEQSWKFASSEWELSLSGGCRHATTHRSIAWLACDNQFVLITPALALNSHWFLSPSQIRNEWIRVTHLSRKPRYFIGWPNCTPISQAKKLSTTQNTRILKSLQWTNQKSMYLPWYPTVPHTPTYQNQTDHRSPSRRQSYSNRVPFDWTP